LDEGEDAEGGKGGFIRYVSSCTAKTRKRRKDGPAKKGGEKTVVLSCAQIKKGGGGKNEKRGSLRRGGKI